MNTLNTPSAESQNRSSKQIDRGQQPDLSTFEERQAGEMTEADEITETDEIETTEMRAEERPRVDERRPAEERLAALFPQAVANDYRSRWDVVQRGFVDDPRQAVRQGDELVAQVLKNLSESFSNERATLEGQLGKADQASTETLRVALRRYRSFFERLLAV